MIRDSRRSQIGSHRGVLCIMGPTASGKTALAEYLAARHPVELVSVDSALVYRGMDIGTAKPAAPHRLVDILDPAERYSAQRFRDDALREIADISAVGRTPLLVGGTMLYFRALFRGLSELPTADPAVRAALDARARAAGWPALHAELARVDPAAAVRIHPNDPQRIQRALEVWEITGKPISELQKQNRESQIRSHKSQIRFHKSQTRSYKSQIRSHEENDSHNEVESPLSTQRSALGTLDEANQYRFHKIAVSPSDRTILHRRIEQRFRTMLDAGFVDEVRLLRARGDLDPDLPSMRTVGYRQVWRHLDGGCDLDEAVRTAIHATRQLAKRQLTWLRKEPDLQWLDPTEPGWLQAGERWARVAL